MTASQAYYDWVKAGQPYRLAKPVTELIAMFRSHGVAFLGDLGNAEHLQNPVPKDHTPFPANPWPSPLPPRPGGYVVCACDHANGPWADTLLADAKAGRVPWLKYLNFGGHHYDVRNHWLPEASSDEHLHISIRSDWTDRTIGGYDPVTGITGDDMDVTTPIPQPADSYPELAGQKEVAFGPGTGYAFARLVRIEKQAADLVSKVDALTAGGVDLDALAAKVAALVPKPPTAAEVAEELAARLGNG